MDRQDVVLDLIVFWYRTLEHRSEYLLGEYVTQIEG